MMPVASTSHTGQNDDPAHYLSSDKGVQKRTTRKRYPAPSTTAPIDDDFDAYTLPATSVYTSNGGPLADAYECTFGGAIEHIVRTSGIYVEYARNGEDSFTLPTASVLRSRRSSQHPPIVPKPEEPSWESLGRRTREGRKGRSRLVPKKVLEDNETRTVTLWREEVVPYGVTLSDESTLAGTVDEFGRDKQPVKSHKPESPTRKRKLVTSSSVKSKSKASMLAPLPSDAVRPATAQSMLGLDTQPLVTVTPLSPRDITNQDLSPFPAVSMSPLNLAKTPSSTIPCIAPPRPPLRPRRISNASVPMPAACTLETLLAECKPSLLHLRPMLLELGITERGHLRALWTVGDTVRNAEIRPIAMDLGMKTIEWAMLLYLASSRA